jgi:S1-C subfamily serine protease
VPATASADEEEPRGLGIQVEDVPARLRGRLDLREGGALITGADPSGAGVDYGLRPGDVILEIDGHAVAGAQDLADQLQGRVKADVLRLRVRTGEGTRYVGVRLR